MLFCLLCSLLLHAAGGGLLLLLPPSRRQTGQAAASTPAQQRRFITLKKADIPAAAQELPFAKTNPDLDESRPETPTHQSRRNSRAASDPNARHLYSEDNAPAVEGKEDDGDALFRQEHQDGDIEHEGKKEQMPPPVPQQESTRRGQEEGAESAPTTPLPQTETAEEHVTEQEDEGTKPTLRTEPTLQHIAEPTLPAKGLPEGEGTQQRPQLTPRRPVYDPSLSSTSTHQAPGFRTQEHATRSSGRFIFGKGAALDVAATPRGLYEAEVYRRVAKMWYRACADHCGDIIPGKLIVSVRLEKSGHLAGMALITRRGASVSQQSFTFQAIRRAELPPMPTVLQREVVGDVMELIFHFHFD